MASRNLASKTKKQGKSKFSGSGATFSKGLKMPKFKLKFAQSAENLKNYKEKSGF